MPDERIISPKKLKDLFDKMTEIDTNPQGRASQQFQESMQQSGQKETKNSHGQITIKTIRRGKLRGVRDEQFVTDAQGRVKMKDKRIIRYDEGP